MKSIIHFNPISEAQKHININLEFDKPIDCVTVTSLTDIKSAVDKLWDYSMSGKWCVGFISFEASPAFDSAYVVSNDKHIQNIPLLKFAVYDNENILNLPPSHQANQTRINTLSLDNSNNQYFNNLSLDEERYISDFNSIIESIKNGDVYQINYTQQLNLNFNYALSDKEWLSYYYSLLNRQTNSYSAYLNWQDGINQGYNSRYNILSFSPELFFHWHAQNGEIITQPMKGTAKRDIDNQENDFLIMQNLKSTLKEQAENIMIVDLLRNDLSKIAKLGSIQVKNIFECLKLQSVWQMVSTVSAVTKPDTNLYDILCALFPCGSITGAPKIESMKIINDLEKNPRGVYCGIIGLIKPFGECIFNVAIRSLSAVTHVEYSSPQSISTNMAYGVGSGITIDAICEQEIKELYAKISFLK
jgi:para-aminobenzoate synthetase/4-amino-4-deoxychorismate lyase